MKILFLRPRPSPETIGLQHVMLVEPLELEVLASLVSPDDTPVIIDLILERQGIGYFLQRERPDVICVTGYITNVPELKRVCKMAKGFDPHIVTIVGGVHCEVCPEDLSDPFIDFRVVRNATTVFPKLLAYLNGNGDLPPGVWSASSQAELPPFDFFFPLPNRKLTARYRKRYFYIFHDKVALIKTSFGCPYRCSFCFCRSITRDHYHERPLEDVIRELILIEERDVYIVDDDFLSSPKRVEDFIRANRKAGLHKSYLLYGRADFIAANPELMQDFASIGLKTVIVGLESFSDNELNLYNKHTDAGTNEAAMRVLNKYGIDCYATIIVSPDWDRGDFERCKQSLLKLGIHYVNLQPLTPLPGTEFTVDDSVLLFPRSDFHKWDLAHVSIRPGKLSLRDYYLSILRVYRAVLFQPKFVLAYLRNYPPRMLWKMLRGVYSVQTQYVRRYR
ncbi:MAG TPA: radical SAM protein [Candidatus Cloacimonadota bacterium]|nr:radical SAM protein [Candidatus Cloacimonadota bacterium]